MSDCVCGEMALETDVKPAWAAVFSMTLGVFALVTAEFLPASLLTPMAATLGVSAGIAGQAVTVTAAMALLAALLVTGLTQGIDRRALMIVFSGMLIVSNALVMLAPSIGVLLLARVLLGLALGGFWSMATAITMRLVPPALVPRALSVLFSGVSVATIAAAPLGSTLGAWFGWRSAFLFAALIGVLALLFQIAALPSLPSAGTARLRTLLEVAVRPGVRIGMVCVVLVFGGHFALFTYVRPYLERMAGVGAGGLSLLLLVFGVGSFVGTFLAGLLLERTMRGTLVLVPVLIGASGLALAALHDALPAQAALVAVWGMAFGGLPVGWSTWLARAVPDQTESAGGLLVAAVQLAIAAGAAAGGLIFDRLGIAGVFVWSGALLLGAALLVGVRVRAVA